MLDHLNSKTRRIICQLMDGDAVSIGGRRIGPFDEQETISLWLVASQIEELAGRKGSSLADEFLKLRSDLQRAMDEKEWDLRKLSGNGIAPAVSDFKITTNARWRIAKVAAKSFRGLAPAGQQWEHDFEGRTHLLHGPNGCGKSSLFGAISWCLTGCIFRDDCDPSPPESVEVFEVSGAGTRKTERPDALTLVNEHGNSSSAGDAYWVEVQLVAKDGDNPSQALWLRRHSVDGLQYSQDAEQWKSLSSIEDVGISELDAELHILMPARVSHLQFGKKPDLVRLFTQIVGMDDLEQIAEVAGRICAELRKMATKKKNGELAAQQKDIQDAVQEIRGTTAQEVQAWPEYTDLIAPSRDLGTIQRLGERLTQTCGQLRQKLAEDLELEVPAQDSDEYKLFQEKLKNLPGQVQLAADFLALPAAQVLPMSMGLPPVSQEELAALNRALAELEKDITKEITERLEWAIEEAADPKTGLLLLASEHFEPAVNACPVCTQDLQPVPTIAVKLRSLKERLCRAHLKKQIDDHERELLDRLENLLPSATRRLGEEILSARMLADWRSLKENRMLGLLAAIAGRFDSRIEDIARRCATTSPETGFVVPKGPRDTSPGAYRRIEEQINAARRYLSLVRSLAKHEAEMRELYETIASNDDPTSLVALLKRGSATNEKLSGCDQTCKCIRELYRKQKAIDMLTAEIANCRSLADSTEKAKGLADLVLKQVMDEIQSVQSQMGLYYGRLYDKELLPFNMLTTGHPANKEVRNEVNAYLKAGDLLVPIGPFSNAGRLRALALSFVFALLSKSNHTLNVLILDDPALSMDDQHKDRFLTYLVAPVAEETQVLLGTHYKAFFERAEVQISNAARLYLTPRRGTGDAVGFEPGNLLQRVESDLQRPTRQFEEAACNLRKWVERAFETISRFAPEPFFVRDNMQATRSRYERIPDPRIATPRRKDILGLLTPEFLKHLNETAHAGYALVDTDIADMLNTLKKCAKYVTAEIEDLKERYYRDFEAAAIEARPAVQLLSVRHSMAGSILEVVGMAAASERGTGVTWEERESVQLCGLGLAVATLDVIAPVAMVGQVLLLDPSDEQPRNEDLVVVKTDDEMRYLRRFWKRDDASIVLESANPTCPYEPVLPGGGICQMRRVIGVLFDLCRCTTGQPGSEWIDHPGSPPADLSGFCGVRVHGKSMEPVARDGQIVLIRESADLQSLRQGDLACVDLENDGGVVKRCFFSDGQWFLTSINQTDVFPPIVVPDDEIRQGRIYIVRGVLFEFGSAVA